MLRNCVFDTYRRTASAGVTSYAASKTITSGDGWLEPAGGDLKAVLGVDLAAKAFSLMTEQTNFQITDRVTISSVNYSIEQFETINQFGKNISQLILLLDA